MDTEGKITKNFNFNTKDSDGIQRNNHIQINHYHSLPRSGNDFNLFNSMLQLKMMTDIMNNNQKQINAEHVERTLIEDTINKIKSVNESKKEIPYITEEANYEVVKPVDFKIDSLIKVCNGEVIQIDISTKFIDYNDTTKQFINIYECVKDKVLSVYGELTDIFIKIYTQDDTNVLFVPYKNNMIHKLWSKYSDSVSKSIQLPGTSLLISEHLKYVVKAIQNIDFILEFDKNKPLLLSVVSKYSKLGQAILIQDDKYIFKKMK